MEALREHLDVERWLLLGGSWGSTLALAYAEAHPDRVSEIVLWGVTTGRRSEADWWFRGGVAPLFPEQWERVRAGVPEAERDGDIVQAYSRMLHDPDPDVRRRAALAWCTWESTTPEWPPTAGPRRAVRGSRLRARVRPTRHALRPARPVPRGRHPAPQRPPARRHPRRPGARTVRPAGADRQRLGAAPRVALVGPRDRRERGARGRHAGSHRGARPCDGPVRMSKVEDLRVAFRRARDPEAFIRKHSNLPGPRGNLELVAAVAEEGDERLFRRLLDVGAGSGAREHPRGVPGGLRRGGVRPDRGRGPDGARARGPGVRRGPEVAGARGPSRWRCSGGGGRTCGHCSPRCAGGPAGACWSAGRWWRPCASPTCSTTRATSARCSTSSIASRAR